MGCSLILGAMSEILITGATGFIGSHLLRQFECAESKPILLTSRPIAGFRCIDRGCSDLRSQIAQVLGGAPIEALFHLGAYTPKDSSQANCTESCNGNIRETERIIAALPIAPHKVVFASTIDVYRFDGRKVSEETTPDPPTLYGASKLYCERMLSCWCAERQVDLQILRIGHVYGAGEESYRKLIPLAIARCLDGVMPQLYTDGSECRACIHVSDVCRMILEAAESGCESAREVCINLVSSKSISVREVIETVIRLTGAKVGIEQLGHERGRSTEFDNRRMLERFGAERVCFQEGLAEEINSLRGIRSHAR